MTRYSSFWVSAVLLALSPIPAGCSTPGSGSAAGSLNGPPILVRPAAAEPAPQRVSQKLPADSQNAPGQSQESKQEKPVLEMVFVLDTTGSMGGLIDSAKQRIWGIINAVLKDSPHLNVRVGLVAYRDHGDVYITRVFPMTSNLDQVYSTLMDYKADGGGDEPEDVRQALVDGVKKAGWSSRKKGLSQVLFLVGDAPPHDDYTTEPDTCKTAHEAMQSGITVNAVQCGAAPDCRTAWEKIAKCGQGEYFAIPESGGAQVIETPYDGALADLALTMETTYIPYGSGASAAAEAQSKLESRFYGTASKPAQAERAINKALNVLAYAGDLLQSLDSGTLNIEGIRTEDLPEKLRKLSPEELKQEIQRLAAVRVGMKATILDLAKQRDKFLESYGIKPIQTQEGFDEAVVRALKKQMAKP